MRWSEVGTPNRRADSRGPRLLRDIGRRLDRAYRLGGRSVAVEQALVILGPRKTEEEGLARQRAIRLDLLAAGDSEDVVPHETKQLADFHARIGQVSSERGREGAVRSVTIEGKRSLLRREDDHRSLRRRNPCQPASDQTWEASVRVNPLAQLDGLLSVCHGSASGKIDLQRGGK